MGTNTKRFIFFILFFVIEIVKLCLCANSSSGCLEQERQALLKFKESIIQDPLHRLSSWKGTNCCQWNGIWCDAVTGHVAKLDLRFESDERFDGELLGYFWGLPAFSGLYMAREVNPSLQELEYLNYLDLSGNSFEGSPVPVFFGSMKHLRYLNLSNAYFGGMVPHVLGNLTELHVLDLSGNGIYIDDLSWATQLSSLQHLDLSFVYLSQTQNLVKVLNILPLLSQLILHDCGLSNMHFEIPDAFQNLTALRVLDLAGNNLSLISSSIFDLKSLVHLNLAHTVTVFPNAIQNLTSLKFLDLSDNAISSVPLWVGKLSGLVNLKLNFNKLRSIPKALQNLTSIKFLDLSYNQINSIPRWVGELSKLVQLDLTRNDLGYVSDILQNLTSITFLDLADIKLNLVPSWIGNLKSLLHLDLSRNELHGPLPTAFQNLTSIRSLIVSGNNIGSSIPKWLGSLKKLVHLDLTNNKFVEIEETLPTIFTNSCELKFLYLSYNNLQGEAFGSHNNLSGCMSYNLELLDLAHNNFTGDLPTWLCHLKNLKNLKYLMLNSNLLIGYIPPFFGELLKLRLLDLSDNHLNEAIPHSLAQLVNLSVLDLSSNTLEGVISKIVAMCQGIINLGYLDLSNNQISGLLPENIGSIIPQVQQLRVANNLINGSIPHSLCTWESLYHLDISQNLFSGTIPDSWTGINKYVINLSSNKLSGNIPSSLGNLFQLEMLHLNNNSLYGEIPVSLKNCTGLVVLDLSENQLSGVIPSWIEGNLPSWFEGNTPSWIEGNFIHLQFLVLGKNMFFGRIPSNLCQLPNLQVLDLGSNNLTGPIPHCFDNLHGMTRLEIDGYLGILQEEEIKQTLKGLELDYTKNIMFVTNLDLSCNNLVGSIPNSLAALSGLIGLNLSQPFVRWNP